MPECICMTKGGPEGCGICNETGQALSASPAPAGDLVERVAAVIRALKVTDYDSADEIARALIAAMQPVGWRYRVNADTPWILREEAPPADLAWPEVEPLYALPAPPGVGGMRVTPNTKRIDLESGSLDDGGRLDDMAISGDMIELVHIEMMDDDACWGRIDLKDGSAIVLWWTAKKSKLIVTVSND
jgi:hypothetical protein